MRDTHRLRRENTLFMQYFKTGYLITTTTVLLSMIMIAIIQLMGINNPATQNFQLVGVPQYLIYFLAFCQLAGVILFLLPGGSVIKEWIYAVFAHTLLFTVVTNCANGISPMQQCFLLLLLIISYVIRKSILTDNGNPRLEKLNKTNA